MRLDIRSIYKYTPYIEKTIRYVLHSQQDLKYYISNDPNLNV